jgi:hypothetical protein
MTRILALLLASTLTACGTQASGEDAGSQGGSPRVEVTTPLGAGGPLDGLTVTLELDHTSLKPGGQTRSTFTVENRTDEPITDPGCRFGSASYDLVPADDPDAELTRAAVVDCSGPFTYGAGYKEKFSGPDFVAAYMVESEPMRPGDYLAAVDIEGFSERLSVPSCWRTETGAGSFTTCHTSQAQGPTRKTHGASDAIKTDIKTANGICTFTPSPGLSPISHRSPSGCIRIRGNQVLCARIMMRRLVKT